MGYVVRPQLKQASSLCVLSQPWNTLTEGGEEASVTDEPGKALAGLAQQCAKEALKI